MSWDNSSLIKLPRKGKALIVTDIHGNLDDFNKFMDIWDELEDDVNHMVLTGDFIHAMGLKNDRSIEILELVKERQKRSSKFHVLLGNHEWSTIYGISVYKGGIDQTHNFVTRLKEYFNDKWEKKLQEYNKFFKKLPIAVKTDNGVFISHAGPPKNVKHLDEITRITDDGYLGNSKLYDLLWNRPDDFSEKELESFLKAVNCRVMIVGHTPVNGAKIVAQNQVVVSSSYSKGKKAYVELDLEKNIKKGKDVLKMVKYIK
jgi:serine/threonine-protein phosphatase PP1 catalytic subunit